MTMYKELHPNNDVTRLFVRKNGGIRLISCENCVKMAENNKNNIPSYFDWLTGLSPSFLIGQRNYFGFAFYDLEGLSIAFAANGKRRTKVYVLPKMEETRLM